MAAPWEENYETAPAAKKPAGSAPPVAVAKPAAAPVVVQSSTPEDFSAEFEREKAAMKKTAEERAVELPKASPLINEKSLLSPPAMVGLGGAAGAALMYGGSKAAPMVKRWLSGQNAPQGLTLDTLDEPPLFGSPAQRQPFEVAEPPLFSQTPAQPAGDYEPPMSRTAAPSQNLTIQEAQARMAGVTPAAPVVPQAVAPEVVPMQPVVPSAADQAALADYESKIATSDEKINKLLAAQQQADEFIRINNEKLAIQNAAPSAAPNSAATKAVTDTIQQLGQAETPVAAMPSRPVTPTPAAALPTGELRTGSGLPAYAGEGKPKERFPKEFKTVADVPKGYAFVPGMGAGTNVIRNDFGQERYNTLVQQQGGPFGADKETREFLKQYNEQRMGPPATRELRKSLGLPLQENTKGIPMKIAKVGGVVGAIMAIPELANAAQNRDAGQAATVASGFLHPALQALIYSGGLNAGAEEETRQLRMRDYALKAGRGVAQGYDPRQLIGVAPPTR